MNIIVLFFLLGWLLLLRKHHTGQKLIGIGLIVLFICGLGFIPNYLIRLLENRITAKHIPDQIDGIIVLVGMVNMEATRPGLIELSDQSDRIVEGIILAQNHPEAKLIIMGGSGSLGQSENLREADYLKRLAISLGVAKNRILIERNSRNTHEHAVEMAKLLPETDAGRWVLITSAFHMPRSFGSFRSEGVKVIPYPVDFKTKSDDFNNLSLTSFLPAVGNINKFSIALHEWIGLITYRLMGYTEMVFPQTV